MLNFSAQRPVLIGVFGTSLSWGADLPDRTLQAWPVVLQHELRLRSEFKNVWVLNGAMRASSADFAALCYDEMFGKAWIDVLGAGRGPRLDLALIEYNWSSSPGQIAALIEALHARLIPVLGILYVHPVNMHRVKTIKRDPTPDMGADKAGRYDDFANVFIRHAVPFVNTSGINHRMGWREVIGPLMSAAHITPNAHRALAIDVFRLLILECSRLDHQFISGALIFLIALDNKSPYSATS